MPELLIELFSEEIPARMQKRAEEDLARLFAEKAKAAGLDVKDARTFSGPRRLALFVPDLPAKTADVNEERKGPRVGAPQAALEGFVKSAGLNSIEEAEIVADKKGDFYVARIARAGRATPTLLQEIIPDIVRAFPWPKSMRSGVSDLTWVRPLHNVMCVFDGAAVRIDLPGVGSEARTWGHRFHAPGAIAVERFDDYAARLRDARVEIDREARKAKILNDARAACAAKGLELVEDAGLLEEVAGLSEWPVVLVGDMDPAFLDLPGEIIRLSMRTHQKYFAVRDPKTGALAPHFVTVANIEAKDGGAAIAAGNARVLSARLNDARFFWDLDLKKGLEDEARLKKLDEIVFHQKLGSVGDKVRRIEALAVELAPIVGADEALVRKAARLCKADLVTETVGEFPELQGYVGRELYEAALAPALPSMGRAARSAGRGARTDGSDQPHEASTPSSRASPPQSSLRDDSSPIEGERSIAIAIEDHYRPLGPNDRVPSDPVAICVALADKLDTLVGFWAIDEKPTGSSDPYALRRAALGVVRIVLAANVRAAQTKLYDLAFKQHEHQWRATFPDAQFALSQAEIAAALRDGKALEDLLANAQGHLSALVITSFGTVFGNADRLISFMIERVRVQLRDGGKRYDLIDAVFAPDRNNRRDDDLVRIVARVEALDTFLKTEDGANLLAGYKRAANILRAEEKKNPDLENLLLNREFDSAQLKEAEEKSLHAALERAAADAANAVAAEDFSAAMAALAKLRAPVDNFFERVLVNAPEENLRLNRLKLLTRMRDALHAVADFSRIEG